MTTITEIPLSDLTKDEYEGDMEHTFWLNCPWTGARLPISWVNEALPNVWEVWVETQQGSEVHWGSYAGDLMVEVE